MSPSTVRVRVVVPDTQSTRDPLPDEWPHIRDYIVRFTDEVGDAPLAVHEVPNVGDVWFMAAPLGAPGQG